MLALAAALLITADVADAPYFYQHELNQIVALLTHRELPPATQCSAASD